MRTLVFLTLVFTCSSAFSLSLREAEDSAFANDPKIRSLQDSQTALDARKSAITAGLFPTFNLGLSESYQVPKRSRYQSTVELRADIKNPLWYIAERDGISADKKILDLDQSAHRHEVLFNVRTNYFKAKLVEQQIDRAQKQLAVLSKLFQNNERKYKQGHIQILDRDRSQVQVLQQEHLIGVLKEDLEFQRSVLALRINSIGVEAQSLNTPLPSSFKSLPPSLATKGMASVKRQMLEYEKKQSELSRSNSEFLPDFYLAFQKNDSVDAVREDRYVAYVGGLTWKLGTGSYYNRKAALAEISARQGLIDFEKQQGQIDLTSLIAELNAILKEMARQEEIFKSLSGISNKNLAQYEAGFVPLSTYYDDFRSMNEAEDALLRNRFKVVELYAKLARHLEDDSIFYHGIGV